MATERGPIRQVNQASGAPDADARYLVGEKQFGSEPVSLHESTASQFCAAHTLVPHAVRRKLTMLTAATHSSSTSRSTA